MLKVLEIGLVVLVCLWLTLLKGQERKMMFYNFMLYRI
jgi:hypothetical protein